MVIYAPPQCNCSNKTFVLKCYSIQFQCIVSILASAGCRYEVDLYIYIFLTMMLAVLWLHSDLSIKRFSKYKRSRECVPDQTDWKNGDCDVSNAILYKLFFFSFWNI